MAAGAIANAGPADQWHVLIEPKFMRYEVAWPIAGSDETVLVPARLVKGEIVPLRLKEVFSHFGPQRKIATDAPEEASRIFAKLVPNIIRDENGVIQYAVLESKSPLTASAVLAPEFPEKFAKTLGPDLLVAIPSRQLVFVFPKQSPACEQLAETVIVHYETSPSPVSLELFELRGGKLIAIGRYR